MKDFTSLVAVSISSGPWHEVTCACYEPDIKTDDICVVATPGNGYEIGYATLVTSPEAAEAKGRLASIKGEIVCKIDDTAYKARVEQRKQERELKAKMAERAKKLQDIVLYETLAKSDPEMQQLLDQYKTLNGF